MKRSCIVLALAFAALPSLSRAQQAETAESLRAQGNELVDNGRAAEAISLYQRAYAISKEPALLYNMGRAAMALGDYPQALTHLEAFEVSASEVLLAKVPGLAGTLAELRGKVTIIHVECNETGALVRLRDRTVGQTPLADFRVNAGDAVIDVQKDGFLPYEKRFRLTGGQTETVRVTLSRVPPREAPARPASPAVATSSPHTLGYVVGGVGIALLGASGLFGGLALSAKSDARCPSPCYTTREDGSPSSTYLDAAAAHDRSVVFAHLSSGAFALGVVGVVAGVYLVLRKPPSAAAAWASPNGVQF